MVMHRVVWRLALSSVFALLLGTSLGSAALAQAPKKASPPSQGAEAKPNAKPTKTGSKSALKKKASIGDAAFPKQYLDASKTGVKAKSQYTLSVDKASTLASVIGTNGVVIAEVDCEAKSDCTNCRVKVSGNTASCEPSCCKLVVFYD